MKLDAFILLGLLGFSSAPRAFPAVGSVEAKAREALRDELAHESGWLKVHAAEVLVAFGEGALVAPVFLEELKLHPDEPRYRVGIHRVLARTATSSTEREVHLRWIAHVFADSAAIDRGHAAETLGKLGAPHSPDTLAAARHWLEHATEEDAIFVQWLLWQSGDEAAGRFIAAHLDSPLPPARLRAAYTLRLTGMTDPGTLAALARAADHETTDAITRAIVIGAAYQLRAAEDRLPAWRESLEGIVVSGPPDAASQALQALMPSYRASDLERLTALLASAKGDVRIAAAWAILSVCASEKN